MTDLRPSFGFRIAAGVALALTAFLILPMLVIVPVSFTPNRYLSMPNGHLSVTHYVALVTDPAWRRGALDSFIVALAASLIAMALGTASAIGCWKIANRATDWIRFIMLAPMIVPPIVHAIGMYRVWADLGLIDTYTGLILAHAMKGVPFVVISVSAALANFDPRLEQAARASGATAFQAVRLVVLPNIRAGLFAGGVFAFAISWDEIVVALFLTSRAVYTLPRKIWDGIQDNISPSVAAVGVILIAATCLAAAIRTLVASRLAASDRAAGPAKP